MLRAAPRRAAPPARRSARDKDPIDCRSLQWLDDIRGVQKCGDFRHGVNAARLPAHEEVDGVAQEKQDVFPVIVSADRCAYPGRVVVVPAWDGWSCCYDQGT